MVIDVTQMLGIIGDCVVSVVAVMLFVLQVVIEMLPVSSSSHMKFITQLAEWCNLPRSGLPDRLEYFSYGLTLIVAMFFFRSHWLYIPKKLMYSFSKQRLYRLLFVMQQTFYILLISTAITLNWYLILRVLGKQWAWLQHPVTRLIGLGTTCFFLLTADFKHSYISNKISHLHQSSFQLFCWLGMAQGVAIFPGISRFACVYWFARRFGARVDRALYYSWLVFAPVMFGMFCVSGLPYFINNRHMFFGNNFFAVVICMASILAAYITLCLSAYMARRHLWYRFGCYIFLFIIVHIVFFLCYF